jgi:hypothetical protein
LIKPVISNNLNNSICSLPFGDWNRYAP